MMKQINPVTQYEVEEGVAVITLDYPPVNALSVAIMEGLYDAFDLALGDGAVTAIVLTCAGRTFIAGADIKNINNAEVRPRIDFFELQERIEASAKPSVAAIHGTALGGGLEVAMTLSYRVAVPSARFGLPEVKLGLLPGGGGTQRLTRLVGARDALDMMTTGEMIDAAEAQHIGLIDGIVPEGELREAAVAFARRTVAENSAIKRIRDIEAKVAADRGKPEIFAAYRKANAKRLRNLDAAEKIIQTVEAAVNSVTFDEGLLAERTLFQTVLGSEQNRALLHNFFAERQAAKVADLPAGTAVLPIAAIGVVGAGTMGRGIALVFINAGFPVTLLESNAGALEKAVSLMRASYDGQIKRGKITAAEVGSRMALLRPTTEFADLAEADLVIEAIFEDMAAKEALFRQLSGLVKSSAILATNTSYLSIDAMAEASGRPGQVIGMHFFSPAHIMKLLEVVRGERTSPEVIATVMKLAGRLGKVPVLARECHGFIGNRMMRMRREAAERLVLAGAEPIQVDAVLEDFGFPMGPFAMSDMAGLDVGWSAAKSTGSTAKEVLCEAGRFGQKNLAGYYDYDEQRNRTPSPVANGLLRRLAEKLGIAQKQYSAAEVLELLLFPAINEGARILEEGIAQRASDIDVVWINGYGFPAYRGGPMYWADQVGLDRVLARVEELHRLYGDWIKPSELLRTLVREGRTFGQAYP
jgi:3-hydroxyacyl-CoA dehydrogenase